MIAKITQHIPCDFGQSWMMGLADVFKGEIKQFCDFPVLLHIPYIMVLLRPH